MPDNLFGTAAGAMTTAVNAAEESNAQDERSREATMRQGSEASAQLGESNRLGQKGQQEQQLEVLKAKLNEAENTMLITPQIALGLVKNTGDKEWMRAVGTKMRSDVLMAMYTHGINAKLQGKEFKVPIGDKIHTLISHVDDEGNQTLEDLGEGERFSPTQKGEETPTKTIEHKIQQQNAEANTTRANTAKTKASAKGAAMDPTDKEFLKTYRQDLKDTEGMNGMLLEQMSKKDPNRAIELQKKLDFVQKYQARFNQLQKTEEGPSSSGGPQKYNSAEEVRAAFKSGTLSREDAKKILADQFGMK